MTDSPHNLEFINRRVVTISLDGNFEEILNSISSALNIPVENLDKEEIAHKIELNKLQTSEIKDITENYSNFLEQNNSTSDKYEELYDITKFLKKYVGNFKFVIPTEKNKIPDFIINVEKLKIGIEHTRLINQEYQRTIGTIKEILNKTKNILAEYNELENQLINIKFDLFAHIINSKTLSDKLKQSEIKLISELIAQNILDQKINNYKLPLYIEQLNIQNTNFPIEIRLIEHFEAKSDFKDILSDTVLKKEKLLDSYKQTKKLDEYWLLIVNSGVKSSSSYNMEIIQNYKLPKSAFNKVFIIDNFDSEIVQIF